MGVHTYLYVCVDVCECILYLWICVQGEHLVHCLAWIYMWAGAGKAFGHLQQFLLLCNHHLIAIINKHYFDTQLCQYVVNRNTINQSVQKEGLCPQK